MFKLKKILSRSLKFARNEAPDATLGAHLLAGGFEKVGVKEQDADGGVAMMKVSKKMDVSLVLKPERWAPGGSVPKAEFFQRFVSKRKRAPRPAATA